MHNVCVRKIYHSFGILQMISYWLLSHISHIDYYYYYLFIAVRAIYCGKLKQTVVRLLHYKL